MRYILDGRRKRWSAAAYAAFFALFALPFGTLYAACSNDRVETINGYQTLAPHDYTYQAANGTQKVVAVPTDGFSWIVIALVAIAIILSLVGFRTLWLSVMSVAGVFALFLAVTAAGGPRAASKAEVGFWLSSVAIVLAPAADVRPGRRAAMVAAATVAVAAALIAVVIGLIALTAQGSRS